MEKILVGGGLGDAAMALAKLNSLELKIPIKDIHLTHVEVHADLLGAISKFYDYQLINHSVIQIPNWDWTEQHKDEFKIHLTTRQIKDGLTDVPINPYPAIRHVPLSNVKILLSPSAGRWMTRNFSYEEIKAFDKKYDVIYVGWSKTPEIYDKLIGKSFINKTNIAQLTDLICSAQYVITPEGFIAYLAAMAGKTVYIKNENIQAVHNRVHPFWATKIINRLDEVVI